MKQADAAVQTDVSLVLRPHADGESFVDDAGARWVTQTTAARRCGVTMQGISRAALSGRLERAAYMGRFFVSLASLDAYTPVARTLPGPRRTRSRRSSSRSKRSK